MTEALSLRTLRHEVYNQIPGIGLAGVADSVAASTLTDNYLFADTTVGQNHYRGFYLFRPALTGDDRVKKILSANTSTGTATIAGSNYVDQDSTDYELVGVMHPDELNAAIVRAQRRCLYDVQVPLSGALTDGDMDASTTASWTNVSLGTMEKVTTAAHVWSGQRSLHTVHASGAAYAESVEVKVFQNTTFFASCVVKVISGVASLIVWDESNDVALNTAVTSGEEGWAHLWVYGNVTPADSTGTGACEKITVRLGSSGAAELYWNHAVFYTSDRFNFRAPSYVDEQHKFLKLRQARYKKTISSQTNGGYDTADSRQFMDWTQPQMFSLDPLHLDANPYSIQLYRAVPREELWIQARRPFTDTEELTTDEATTRAPFGLLMAYIKNEIAKVCRKRYPNNEAWATLFAESMEEIEAELKARPQTPRQPIKNEQTGWI